MGVIEINSLKELQVIKGVAAVYFWASWSKPCGQMSEIFAHLSEQHPLLHFAKVEAEAVPEVSEKYEIESVPHFLFLKNGAVIDKVEGFNPVELGKKVTQYSKANSGLDFAPAAPLVPQKADLNSRLTALINTEPVMLFMKGSPDAPQCGFSSKIVNILRENGAKFGSFNILSDQEVREGLKKFSNWPTYPQLYIDGKLVGGLDIVKELAEQGELKDMLPKGPQSLNERVEALLRKAPVMLFMKGVPDAPKCGFSSKIVNILQEAGVKYSSFDILSDEEIRQGLKTYSNWPTYPQLYVNGKLVGGLDIVKELVDSGEFKDMIPANAK